MQTGGSNINIINIHINVNRINNSNKINVLINIHNNIDINNAS